MILFFLSTAHPAWSAQSEAQEQKKPTEIDLNLTLELLKTKATLTRFPQSTAFAFSHTYSILALAGAIEPQTRKKIVDFIKTCQKEDGGFGADPKPGHKASAITTYYALKSLDLLNALQETDTKKTTQYLLSLVHSEGGFRGHAGANKAFLPATYFGVSSLHLLNTLDTLDKQKTTAYILRFKAGKGFSMMQKSKGPSPSPTYMATKALKLLGGLTDGIKSEVTRYLKANSYFKQVDDNNTQESPYMKTMAQLLETGKDVSAVGQLDSKRIHGHVKSLFLPDSGGFKTKPNQGSSPHSIYHAVLCLVRLGKLKDPYSKV